MAAVFRFTSLPRELQTAIAGHVPLKDLKNMALCSKETRSRIVSMSKSVIALYLTR